MPHQQYFVNDPPQQHAKDTSQSLLHTCEPLHETFGVTRSFPALYASTSNSHNWRDNETQPRLPGSATCATPESPRYTEDARGQRITAPYRSTQSSPTTTLGGTSALQDPQRQPLRSQEVPVQDPPLGQLPDSGHEDDALSEQRVKRFRRTNAKRPMPITGEVHDFEYMGFASDDEFRHNSNHTVNGLERAHIAPQLVLMYPKPDWDPKPPIDFKVGGKLGVNLQEAHKAYLRDVVHVELDPLDQCIQVTDSKARGRLPVMIYIRWPDYDNFRMSVSLSNHRVRIQSSESVRYLAGRIAFVVSNFLQNPAPCLKDNSYWGVGQFCLSDFWLLRLVNVSDHAWQPVFMVKLQADSS